MTMFVIKRDGEHEPVQFDKITNRIKKLCYGLDDKFIDPTTISMKVIQGIYSGITTAELDQLSAETCAYSSTYHPDFSVLAARISVSRLHKETDSVFSRNIRKMYEYTHPKTGAPAPLVSKDLYDVVMEYADKLDNAIYYDRDYDFDYFGFKTLERSYLLKMYEKPVERPQSMFMRVACGIHMYKNAEGKAVLDLNEAINTYNLMSQKFFTHATPTLYNAGTPRPQLSSCFLLHMEDDIDHIFKTIKDCAHISKFAGGIGINIHDIRATRSYIRGTNGISNGIVPMLRVFSDVARYIDQGGCKRKGSIAIYIEPWHADIYDFLELKKNNGKEEMRARDLFYGLWISDLFMERVEANDDWTLFCPNEAPGLSDVYGDEFKNLYLKYESEGKGRQTIKAQHLWFAILQSQIETGTPYMLYKDSVNKKSNQKNLGTIRSSNLCAEIVEYTSKDEIAVCNLASIALNAYVKRDGKNTIYDYTKLLEVAKTVAKNLNKVIDINYYPVPETETSNKRHRPIGIGVQALADTFAMMEYPFESPDAAQLNRNIFETIYYGALSASCELSEKYGPYETFQGSPASQGILQFDMWNVVPNTDANLGPVYDWTSLKERIKKFGLRNSLLLAPMPTASTAQILGNNESIEPFTSNLYTRRVLAGEFPVVNKHLMRTLVEMGLWDEKMRMQIIAEKGSIQNIANIPQKLKDLYKTVWEIKMKSIIDMAADRGAFICQTQSLNMFVAEPSYSKLTSMHFYAWKKGLKTGMYYLRTKPKAEAIQFTVDQNMIKEIKTEAPKVETSISNEDKSEALRLRREEAERKKREIREAIARGDYEHKDEVCISCSG